MAGQHVSIIDGGAIIDSAFTGLYWLLVLHAVRFSWQRHWILASHRRAGVQIETEEDALWRGDHRETHGEIRARGRAFMAWLLARPERRLAVVTHSSFLFFLLSCYGHQMAASVQGELHRW